MFVSKRFVYLELHKTGSSHIRSILKDLLDGKAVGKHNQATSDLFVDERVFLGSIRDPWEWYISLWGYGCDNKGALFGNVTKPRKLYIRGLGWSRNPYAAFLQSFVMFKAWKDSSSKSQAWRDTYSDIDDVNAFRRWLYMMHDEKFMADIREGYRACSVSRVAGLMTFRYLNLFCTKLDEQNNLNRLSTMKQIMDYDNENCFIDYFIRNETLELDLFRGLEDYGVELPSEIKAEVLSRPKTNTSSRKNKAEYYYDKESEKLVAERERLIIDKFGYVTPSLRAKT